MKNFIREWAAISSGVFISCHIMLLVICSAYSFVIFSPEPFIDAIDQYDWLTFRFIFCLSILLGFIFSIVEN